MKSSSLYGHLTELLSLVREAPAPADATVRRFFRERRYLGAHERRWLAARLFGTVRHLRLLEHIVREVFQGLPDRYRALFAGQEPVPAFAVAAAHGIVFENDAVPDVCEAVRERWIAAMPDVDPGPILGALTEQSASLNRRPASVAVLALQHSFPESVVGEWADRLGIAEAEQLLVSLNQEAPLSIRVNTLKCSVSACADRLNAEGTGVRPGALSPFALTLQRRVVLDTIPAFRDGWFEMQDEGSQLLSLLLRPEPGMTVVDACAGGGGKTLHFAALAKPRGHCSRSDRRKLGIPHRAAGRRNA
jgi:16S rRNA (cytosine967-C5)-methyltransferase